MPEGFVKSDIMSHPSVETWKAENPRQWWAYQQLKANDELRERVLAAVLEHAEDDEAIDDLVRFADALEAHRRAVKAGRVRRPPGNGERRSFPILVHRMTRMRDAARVLFFRVDFFCPDGWGGFFDTVNPSVVETISKRRDHAKPLTIVGEVCRRPYEFFVELDGNVRIV
jgi:hypothetical protein